MEDQEDNYHMSNDPWEAGVVTDEATSAELQLLISNTITKCRSIIKMIKKSSILTAYVDKLKVVHKVRRSLSIDCKTRWNSSKYMFETLLKHKPIICRLHSDRHDLSLSSKTVLKIMNLELSSYEWHLIEAIDHVLAPFSNATKLISGRKYATIGTCFFAVRKIKQFLETSTANRPFLIELNELLLQKLTHYFDEDVQQFELIQV